MEKKTTGKKKKSTAKKNSVDLNKVVSKQEYMRLAKKNGWPIVKPDVN